MRQALLLGAMAMALSLVSSAASAQADPLLVGAWTGTATQTYPDGTVDELDANVVFLADGTGTTDYPAFECSGTLTPIATEGPGVFREVITVGLANCASNGVFTFTLAADGLRFVWTSGKFGTASGVLQRVGGK